MSLVSVLLQKASISPHTVAPLTRVQRLQLEIDECDTQPVRVYRKLTCTMARGTELNESQLAVVAEHKAGLKACLEEIRSS